MFTDVEMAILSQLTYYDYPKKTPASLHNHLSKHRSSLVDSLGADYEKSIDAMIAKTQNQSYTIVATEEKRLTGFAALAIEDPDHQVTVACRGTEMGKLLSDPYKAVADVTSDALLAFDKETPQQKDMRLFMEKLQTNGYSRYYFTGHSLGGNLATYGSFIVNDPLSVGKVISFNAPGFNAECLNIHRMRITGLGDQIVSYQNKRDAISETLIVPGNIVELKSRDETADGISSHFLNGFVISDDGNSFVLNDTPDNSTTTSGKLFHTLGYIGNELNNTYHNAQYQLQCWSGTTLRIPLSQLQNHASQLQQLAEKNMDIFDRINNSLQALRDNGEWKGISVEAAINATVANKEEFSKTIQEINSLASFLQKFVTDIENCDIELKGRIQS